MSLPSIEELADLHAKIIEADAHEERTVYHVMPDGAGGWDIIWQGHSRGYSTREEAVALARRWARSEWLENGTTTELYLEGSDGRVDEKNTYGHDPRKTVG